MTSLVAIADQYAGHQMSMDKRHAEMVGRFLLRVREPGKFIEVGCCYGVSTARVLEAGVSRGVFSTLVDPHPQDSVLMMLSSVPADYAELVAGYSHEVIGSKVHVSDDTIILLDGDHRRQYMEIEAALILSTAKPAAFILHDVTNRSPDCDGPGWLMHYLQSIGYSVAIDCMPRDGERTDRGLAILCRRPHDHDEARASCASA